MFQDAAPRGFATLSAADVFRIEWRTRGAGARWVCCWVTLALGLVLPLMLVATSPDTPGARSALMLVAGAALALTLQLIPLRRRFFIEIGSGQLVTDATRKPLALSSLRRAEVLRRDVVWEGKDGTRTETWHELWLHLEWGTRIQVGSRMDVTDAEFLREQLRQRAPRLELTEDNTAEDVSEPGKWMTVVGWLLTVALVMQFGGFSNAAHARQSAFARRAFELAAADPAVTAAVGGPLEWDGHAGLNEPKPDAARLSADVRGPSGSGTLDADGYFKDDAWCFAVLQVRTPRVAVQVSHPACTLSVFERDAIYYVPPHVSSGGD
jgi:hypothetical protein